MGGHFYLSKPSRFIDLVKRLHSLTEWLRLVRHRDEGKSRQRLPNRGGAALLMLTNSTTTAAKDCNCRHFIDLGKIMTMPRALTATRHTVNDGNEHSDSNSSRPGKKHSRCHLLKKLSEKCHGKRTVNTSTLFGTGLKPV